MIKGKKQFGFTLLEVVIAVSLLTIVLVGSFKLVADSISLGRNTGEKIQAYYLASQGIEATRSIKRNSGWAALTTGSHSPNFTGSWQLDGGGTITLDKVNFTRTVSISTEFGTKKIISEVTWPGSINNKVKLITYIGN